MNLTSRGTLLAAAIAAGLSLAACDQRSDTAGTRTPSTPMSSSSSSTAGADAKRSADDAVKSARRAGDSTGDAANRAADKTAQSADDSAVTAKVKAALLAEPGLDSLDIHVDTTNGAVTLSGNVDSPEKKSRAKDVATKVSGVKNVVDNLAVKKG